MDGKRNLRAAGCARPGRRLCSALPALLAACMLIFSPSGAEAPALSLSLSSAQVLPGDPVVISFTVPEPGLCTLSVVDSKGDVLALVAEDRPVSAGYNALYWNGTWLGLPVTQGTWFLRLEMNGAAAQIPVTVGKPVPLLISAEADRASVLCGKKVAVTLCASEAGEALLSADGAELLRAPVPAGESTLTFEAALPPGEHTLTLTLLRADGALSQPRTLSLATFSPRESFRAMMPAAEGDYSLNAWTLPLDLSDEEAVWQALTAPVTVLDDGKDKAQVRQATIRREPRADSEGIGVVTLLSQGVHVLDRGEEWTLIECFSSSFISSDVLNWNAPVRGYVRTALLREVIPNQEMGLVVDKLTQRLYLFREGKLFSTLLVSTGLANERQPYNETRSGEFLLVSRVGAFTSDNMVCRMALRFNADDLIHEVPRTERDGWVDYSAAEPKLGSRASHGCIRVQRKKNPEGINMEWLFTHYQPNTKLLVWEDWQGRQIPVPADDALFLRNPLKQDYYHCSAACPLLETSRPAEITYAALSAEDSKLRPCPACGPAAKKETLLEINALYAPGGDHDPVLTEARKSCPAAQKGR